jgi:hypothetical protein
MLVPTGQSPHYEVFTKAYMTNKIVAFFSGKKTYLIGALMIALGLLQHNTDMVMQGFAVISGRAAIAKMTPSA